MDSAFGSITVRAANDTVQAKYDKADLGTLEALLGALARDVAGLPSGPVCRHNP